MSGSRWLRAVLPVAAAAAMLSCAGPERRGGSAPPQPLPVLRIATQSPLSGDRTPLGRGIRNGAQLAVAEGADRIAALGFSVEVVAFDDRASPVVGVANAERIAADPTVLLVIGHLTSSVALPASEVYQRHGLAMISPASTHPRLTERGFTTVFRVVGRDDGQGAAGAEFAAADLRARRVFLVHDGTPDGARVAAAFRRRAVSRGIKVTGETDLAAGVERVLGTLAAAPLDLVYLAMPYQPAGTVIREARKPGVKAMFLGPDWLDSPLILRAGAAVAGTAYTTVAGPPSFYPDVDGFVSAYRRRFAAEPPAFALQAHDAAAVGLEAIARAIGKTGIRPARGQVREEIRTARDFRGRTGTIAFDARGDLSTAAYFVVKIVSVNPLEWEQRHPVKTLYLPPPRP